MYDEVASAIDTIRAAAASLDRDTVSAGDAERLVDLFAEGERVCQAARSIAAQRVLKACAWRAAGYRTPAQWLAARTKTPLPQAVMAVETAHRLERCEETRKAFVSGELSEVQAAEIAAAATADPASEGLLLAEAARGTVAQLRERCREVRAAAASDEGSVERIRRGRFLRSWSDADGAVRLDARLAPDDGARMLAVLRARAAQLQDEAKRSGRREPAAAYAADALVELAAGTPGPKAVVHVHVDQAALERGRVSRGERCRIDGVGPVPVAVARRLATDAIVKAVADDGADVRAVAHLGRTIPARMRTALELRDPGCVVPGCEVRSGLEIDHVVPFARGGPTSLENLARLCRYHHAQKTHRGWRLEGRPGAWSWVRGGSAR